jgi:hypothetical protein
VNSRWSKVRSSPSGWPSFLGRNAHVIRAFETVGQGDADDEGASGGFDDLMMTERNYGTNRSPGFENRGASWRSAKPLAPTPFEACSMNEKRRPQEVRPPIAEAPQREGSGRGYATSQVTQGFLS